MKLYKIINLGTVPQMLNITPNAINGYGRIVGTITLGGFRSRAFRWSNTGIDLLPLLPGFADSVARDINDSGAIVGSCSLLSPSDPSDSLAKACKWKGGLVNPIDGLPPEERGIATGINNAGKICGAINNHGCVWENGVITYFKNNNPGGIHEEFGINGGRSINSTGDVYGFVDLDDAGYTVAVRWDNAGLPYDLDYPESNIINGRKSLVNSVNDAGIAVGHIEAGYQAPYYWSTASKNLLGTPSGDPGEALDINSTGQVVGWINDGTGNRAVLWTGPTLTDLNVLIDPSLGWRLTKATALNNIGQITGVGLLNGMPRAWLMTPDLDLKITKRIPLIFWQIIFGVATDGPGAEISINGKFRKVPPWNPMLRQIPQAYRTLFKELLEQQVSKQNSRKKR